MIKRREFIVGGFASGLMAAFVRPAGSASVDPVEDGSILSANQVKRIIEALRSLGEPLPENEAAHILSLLSTRMNGRSTTEIERILDRYTLVRLHLDKHGVGKATPGGASRQLAELGWRSFLVRVENPARLTGSLVIWSRSAIPEGDLQPGLHESHILGNDVPESIRLPPDLDTDYERGPSQWMGYRFGAQEHAQNGLEGALVDYQILQIYSQLGGNNTASLALAAAAMGPPSHLSYDCTGFLAEFECRPATSVALKILDSDGRGAMASLLIYDEVGRLYPAPAHRLEPDLGYQPQIYRADGETLRLPVGRYQVTVSRGPEYLPSHEKLVVPPTATAASLTVQLERWIDATRFGWYPSDPHLHPEGQVYGVISKYGLTPETMFRQVCGEALSVGSILIWAGGYYYEKQFLTGHVYNPTYTLAFPDRQRANNTALLPHAATHNTESLIRYDAEQAAFPTNLLGHLVLLRLKSHDFPGARSIYDWPSWNLPILQWARAEGAIGGFAHIGHGVNAISNELPNYEIPVVFGTAANECVVDVTHGAVDFVAGCERPPAADLNPWYHLLNCGFRIPMIGETDFVSEHARVGAARTYVKLDRAPVGDAGYAAWIEAIKAGRLYFGDGRSHCIDFRANDHAAGVQPLELRNPGKVALTANVACRLEPTPFDIDAQQHRDNCYIYWHIERARIGSTRRVPLEVVVNGHVVERREILADGELRPLSVTIDVPHSSWVALRILPSVHTMPVFVSISGQPVRASRRSAQWCLDYIEAVWQKLSTGIRESERPAAAAAWDHAGKVYRGILSECATD